MMDKLSSKLKVGEFDQKMIKEQVKLSKRAKSKVVYFLCLSFLLCCSLFWVSQIFGIPFSLPCIILYETSEAESFLHEKEKASQSAEMAAELPISSSISNGTMHCDRSHFRTDVCFMKGDIRTHSSSSSIFLYTTTQLHSKSSLENQQLIIRPYTRKWEADLMTTIDELHLISKPQPLHKRHHKCDVVHHVPAIFFSTGGYTGNVYHEFNDGIIPLYITSRHYNKKVIFVILEYHNWWYMKYGRLLSQLSDYPPIDFKSDPRTHCFQEAVVGLQIHNELAIDSSIMPKHESILDFRGLLGQAFEPHPPKQIVPNQKKRPNKPKVVVLSRSGPRSITNENTLVKLAQKMGFSVQVLKPKPDIELGTIYKAISSSDVMIGVHGAAMTHFLFLKPGSTVIQVVPLGTDWAAEAYYGEPAKKFGLKYIEYKIDPRESSLYHRYDENDAILRDPDSVNKKGWEFTKKIYLDDQYVTLNLMRFNKILIRAYEDYFNTSTSGVTM